MGFTVLCIFLVLCIMCSNGMGLTLSVVWHCQTGMCMCAMLWDGV